MGQLMDLWFVPAWLRTLCTLLKWLTQHQWIIIFKLQGHTKIIWECSRNVACWFKWNIYPWLMYSSSGRPFVFWVHFSVQPNRHQTPRCRNVTNLWAKAQDQTLKKKKEHDTLLLCSTAVLILRLRDLDFNMRSTEVINCCISGLFLL